MELFVGVIVGELDSVGAPLGFNEGLVDLVGLLVVFELIVGSEDLLGAELGFNDG